MKIIKKYLIPSIFLFIFLMFTNSSVVTAGPQCTSEGGFCRYACDSGESSIGRLDCYEDVSGMGLNATCCKPGAPGCKNDFESCNTNTECCSAFCDSNSQTCRPITSAPASAIRPSPCPIDNDPEGGLQTALGCIPTKETSKFVSWLLKWAIGLSGGIAFILIIFAGVQIITSAGDPQKLQAGKELLSSAITGLVFIVFSLFLLQLIGVEILAIPEFGTP